MKMLSVIYPTLDWDRVSFYEGLPWFTPLVAPYVTAQVLPDFYSFGKYRIYLKKIDESRAQCLADIAHEGFHILQAMHFGKGYGIGFLRGFMIYYLVLFFTQGYRMNSLEIPAYDQEYRFLSYCSKHGLHGIIPKVRPQALTEISKEKDLIFRSARLEKKINPLLLLVSFVLCILIAVLRPLCDVIVFGLSLLAPRNKKKKHRVRNH